MRKPRTKYIHIEEFAGGGGATTGRRLATGRSVDVAVNHDLEAIAMHAINHPETLHYCESVWKVDPLDVLEEVARRSGVGEVMRVAVGSGWFSPDCKHFSKAKGGSLFDKRIRGLAYIILKWCGRAGGGSFLRGPACPLVLFLENVEEWQTWGPLIAKRCPATGRVVKIGGEVAAVGEVVPYAQQWLIPDPARAGLYFRRFIRTLEKFGGVCAWRELRACDYGAPTIRKRLFLIVRFDGAPIVWPEPTHGDPESAAVKSGKLKPWLTAASCIDFSRPCPSIFLTKPQARKVGCIRPLAKATRARIAEGVRRYVLEAKKPFIVELTHEGNRGFAGIDDPLKTITGANRGEKAVVSPVLAPIITEHANASHQRNFAANAPLRTQCAQVKGGHFAVVAPVLHGCGGRAGQSRPRSAGEPVGTQTAKADTCVAAVHLTKFRSGAVGSEAGEPMPTVTANSFIKRPGGCAPIGVVSAFLAQHNGGMVGHAPTEPVSTLTGKGSNQAVIHAALTKYYGAQQDPQMGEAMHTVTTKDRFALLETTSIRPPFTPELAAMARRVAKFLRKHGVQFDGEFAMVGDFVIIDIGMRMLTPRELYNAQSFPADYIIDRGVIEREDGTLQQIPLTKTAQVKMCGNSVCPVMAEALIAANPPRYPVEETEEIAA
jgi:DNA (cytosine-5)-methyltransferase 1